MRKRVMSRTSHQYEEWDEYQCTKCDRTLELYDNKPDSVCDLAACNVSGPQVVCPECHSENERFMARLRIKTGPLQALTLRKSQLERELTMLKFEIEGADVYIRQCLEKLENLEVF